MEGNKNPNHQNGERSTDHTQQNGEKSPTPPPHMSFSPTKSSGDAEAYKKAGNRYFVQREYTQAAEMYSLAVSAAPQKAVYLTNRAAAYMCDCRYQDALKDCQNALVIEPENPKILTRIARIYTQIGEPDNALQVFDKAAKYAPVSEEDRKPALQMQSYISQAEQAVRSETAGSIVMYALDMAEKGLGNRAPKPKRWVLLRGEAYLIIGNLNAMGSAQEQALNLLRQNDNDPEALVLRGRALYGMGDNGQALLHFKKALSCDPDYKDAVRYLRMVQKLDRMKEEGNALYKSGKSQQAVEVYTQALNVDPKNRLTNSKILHNRALASIKLKDYKSALSDCDRALSIDRSYVKARKTKARALGESGDWEASVKEYKSIQEANPNEEGIANDIRRAELELKKAKRKDLYKILGVDKDATDNEIKKSYRKLAIIHHPDKNPGDESAAERFKDIGEAYETLSDPNKRARYDSGEDLLDPMDMSGGMGGGGVQIDPSIIFNMMGGQGGRPGGGFTFTTGGNRAGGGFPGFPGF